MKTQDFFEKEADNIIEDLCSFWSVQKDENGKKYLNCPFKSKEEFLDDYESATYDLIEELEDYEQISEKKEREMLEEQRERISTVYDSVLRERKEMEQRIKMKELNDLKKDYYENNISLEELGNRFDELKIDCENDYTQKNNYLSYVPCLFYDYKDNPKILVFLEKDNSFEENIKIIEDAIKEYYEFNYFYFEVTGLKPVDIVRLVLKRKNISATSVIDLFHDTEKRYMTINYEKNKGDNWKS